MITPNEIIDTIQYTGYNVDDVVYFCRRYDLSLTGRYELRTGNCLYVYPWNSKDDDSGLTVNNGEGVVCYTDKYGHQKLTVVPEPIWDILMNRRNQQH